MNTETVSMFSDPSSELSALCSGAIDLTDFPSTPSPILQNCPNAIESAPVSSNTYYEIEFHLGNNFWGVPFQFGNNASGIQIRQGIAHLVDKQKFASTEPSVGGQAVPIDNPVPPSNGLPGANPCAWDSAFPETGTSCTVGALGGTAYHISSASGLCGSETSPAACQFQWMPGFGSSDFCAAAEHFVKAGLATGTDSNCVLTGLNTAAIAAHPVQFFARQDQPRLDLGNGLSQDICALFTGAFTIGCTTTPGAGCISGGLDSFPANAILCIYYSTLASFPGFNTSTTGINLNWWIYFGGFGSVNHFDSSLYGNYNSLFVSGGSWDHPPCASTTPSSSAANYMYLCVPTFDSFSNQMESAPCLSAPGDPAAGQSSPTFATCQSSTKLTGVSAGYKAQDTFGMGAYTIPIYSPSVQFAYQSNWSRVINAQGVGIPNYFTWLDAYSPNPAVSGTLRQGFDYSTSSLNPYTASTEHDFFILNNIYDTLYNSNPLSPNQSVNWMTSSSMVLNNTQLTYAPPAGTAATVHNVLRHDLFWHDSQLVTAWDVKFAYLTLPSTCAFCQNSLKLVTGVTVVSPTVVDIHLSGIGLFTAENLGSQIIIPGHVWSSCGGSTWNSLLRSSSSDVNGPAPIDSCMTAPSTFLSASFDPLAANMLIGSGPWTCQNPTTGVVGGGCSSTGAQNPPAGGTYTLTRFGCSLTSTGTTCLPPASPPFQLYNHSASDLALYIWTGMTGNPVSDFSTLSTAISCEGAAVGTPACLQWQQGIGNPNGDAVTAGAVGLSQDSIFRRYYTVNWTSPYSWTSLTGIGSFPPVLYEGSVTLNPAPVSGHPCNTAGSTFNNGAGYNC